MTSFALSIPHILKHEGSTVVFDGVGDDVTKFGVTLSTFKAKWDPRATKSDIWNLTKERAIQFYYFCFWIPLQFEIYPIQTVADKVFDMCVNMGESQGIRLLQNTLGVVEDGITGPITIEALNNYKSTDLVDLLCETQAKFYRSIVERKPDKTKYLNGWLKRAAWRP